MTSLFPRERAWSIVWLVFGLSGSWACGGGVQPDQAGTAARGEAVVGGTVVSTVDGHPITAEQVLELARAGNLSAAEALRRLQADRVLMAEAQLRGYGSRSSVHVVARRARVQSLLEQLAGTVQVEESVLRERYAAAGVRFVAAERRASLHVLAQLDPDATPAQEAEAKAYAERMVETLSGGGVDPDAMIAELHGKHEDGFTVVVQKLPPVPDTVNFAKPYLDALFSLDAPGVYPEPVRTPFGWHAVQLLEIVPAKNVSYEQARPELLQEALLKARTETVTKFIEELRANTPVQEADGAREAMASLEP